MKDCDNGQRYSSRIYTNTNTSRFCHSRTIAYGIYSIYKIILEQLCDYKIIEGGYYEDYKLVRQIKSKKEALSSNSYGYKNYQQCWTRFKCPDDLLVYWRRAQFYTESSYDRVVIYGVNNGDYRRYDGNYGSSTSWYTLYDNEITFEFKTDSSVNDYRGFEFLLTCK